MATPQLMSYAGMNWVKFQHKWGPGDDPSAVAGRIQQAHANGFKVLLSIPGSETYPSSIDFNGYVEFLRGVAALGPDAIEVWNEENIDFEWPAGRLIPTSYVNNMLAPAYNAIKGANSSVMVISGAPAPDRLLWRRLQCSTAVMTTPIWPEWPPLARLITWIALAFTLTPVLRLRPSLPAIRQAVATTAGTSNRRWIFTTVLSANRSASRNWAIYPVKILVAFPGVFLGRQYEC